MALLNLALRDRLLAMGRWSLLACLFSVPINKPATNIFIFFALLFAILGTNSAERFRLARKQPVVMGASVWFVVLLISAVYAPGGMERFEALGSYKALFYPLIGAMLLDTTQWRNRGLMAFGLAVGLVLLISWAQFFGLVPMRDLAETSVAYRYTVFKDYTQQGVAVMVFSALVASFAYIEMAPKRKYFLWSIAALAFINVVFLSQSRTAYLIAAPLLLFWIWKLVVGKLGGWRGVGVGVVVLGLVSAAALLSPRVQDRLRQAESDVSLYSKQREPTSMGIRLELWQRTLPIIAAAPLFGHGLGQWHVEYVKQTKDLPNFSSFMMGHPHQEALLILAEQGLVGFAIFLGLLFLLARKIARLDQPYRNFYWCLLLIYVTAGLANCILADFSHRHVFLLLLSCFPYTAPVLATRNSQVSI